TSAALDPGFVARAVEEFAERILVAVDVRGGHAMVKGWREEGPPVEEVIPVLNDAGTPRYLVTAIARDGTLEGPDLRLYRHVLGLTDRPVIASGGVRSAADIWALRDAGCEAAVTGKAVYEKTLKLSQVAGRWTGGGLEDSFVLRLGPGGEPVAAFGGDGLATVNFGKQETANAVSFAPSGAIDIGGYVSNGTTMRSALARLRPNGTLDPAFGGDGRQILDLSAGAEQVNDLVVMPSGDIVAAGYAEFGTVPRFAIFRVHGNGDVATGFGHAGVTRTDVAPGADIAHAIVVTGTGGFVLAGSAANGGHADWGIVRYTPKGL